jgi:ATP-dependent Clp protease ATP-binding subunit ClpA
MFERFSTAARELVKDAQEQARRLEHGWIGTEHLLLALLAAEGRPGELLRDAGLTTELVTDAIQRLLGSTKLGADDAAALRTIGIDLDEVRARIEEHFGPVDLNPPPPPPRRRFRFGRRRQQPTRPVTGPITGHIPFTPRSKKVLELSLREALRLDSRSIELEHLLLGLLREGEGLAALVFAESGVDLGDLRRRTEDSLRKAA